MNKNKQTNKQKNPQIKLVYCNMRMSRFGVYVVLTMNWLPHLVMAQIKAYIT